MRPEYLLAVTGARTRSIRLFGAAIRAAGEKLSPRRLAWRKMASGLDGDVGLLAALDDLTATEGHIRDSNLVKRAMES
jgi:hypothetical protein